MNDTSTLISAITNGINSLKEFSLEKEREISDLAKSITLMDVDGDSLSAFMKKPYVLRKLHGNRFELFIPKFINFSAGFPLRVEGEYNVFIVSMMTDLFSPLPDWLRSEVGYERLPFKAHVEDGVLLVTEGDPSKLAERLDGKLFTRRSGNKFIMAKGSKFNVMRQLIRMGVFPYIPKPVPASTLRTPHSSKITLREKQQRDFEKFLKVGNVTVVAKGGAGKTFFGIKACEYIKGKKIIFAPRKSILEQWKFRIASLAPHVLREIEFTTYQAALRRKSFGEYALMIMDEAQTMPSDMGMRVAGIQAQCRIGLTATPWREDGNEDIIPAACGFVVGLDWETYTNSSASVWITETESDKFKHVSRLLEKKTEGKTWIYVYRLDDGEALSRKLKVPFVSGKTKKQYEAITAADTVIVSKVADAGISADVTRIIEFSRLGGRTEAGQRALRTAHSNKKGEIHFILTKSEYRTHSYRFAALSALDFEIKVAGA